MADQITLLAVAAQQNVAPLLGYLRGGEVPLADQKKTAAFDVTNYARLSLDLIVSAATNKYGQEGGITGAAELVVTIEDAPTATGPWKPFGMGFGGACAGRFERISGAGTRRLVLAGFDNWIRASWFWIRPGYPPATESDQVALTFGVLGSAS